MDGLMENPIKMDDLGVLYFRKHPNDPPIFDPFFRDSRHDGPIFQPRQCVA